MVTIMATQPLQPSSAARLRGRQPVQLLVGDLEQPIQEALLPSRDLDMALDFALQAVHFDLVNPELLVLVELEAQRNAPIRVSSSMINMRICSFEPPRLRRDNTSQHMACK